jgi:hypothetical protein
MIAAGHIGSRARDRNRRVTCSLCLIRHCERSEAIQLTRCSMDCFASLAMTGLFDHFQNKKAALKAPLFKTD